MRFSLLIMLFVVAVLAGCRSSRAQQRWRQAYLDAHPATATDVRRNITVGEVAMGMTWAEVVASQGCPVGAGFTNPGGLTSLTFGNGLEVEFRDNVATGVKFGDRTHACDSYSGDLIMAFDGIPCIRTRPADSAEPWRLWEPSEDSMRAVPSDDSGWIEIEDDSSGLLGTPESAR